MPKILNSNVMLIFTKFQDFSRTFSLFFLFQAWKFIFSFSRFSRVRGKPCIFFKVAQKSKASPRGRQIWVSRGSG